MYSTSIGLVLKGYEYKELLKEKNIEINQEEINQGKEKNENEEQKKSNGFFNNFKKNISNFFDDDKDTKM